MSPCSDTSLLSPRFRSWPFEDSRMPRLVEATPRPELIQGVTAEDLNPSQSWSELDDWMSACTSAPFGENVSPQPAWQILEGSLACRRLNGCGGTPIANILCLWIKIMGEIWKSVTQRLVDATVSPLAKHQGLKLAGGWLLPPWLFVSEYSNCWVSSVLFLVAKNEQFLSIKQ